MKMRVLVGLVSFLVVATFFSLRAEDPEIKVECPSEGYLCNMEIMSQSTPGCALRTTPGGTCKLCKRNVAGTTVSYCVTTTGPTIGCHGVGTPITCGLKYEGSCVLVGGEWKCESTNVNLGPCEMKTCQAGPPEDRVTASKVYSIIILRSLAKENASSERLRGLTTGLFWSYANECKSWFS